MDNQTTRQATSYWLPLSQIPKGHADRIRQELVAAGVTRFGLRKFAAHYLHRIIHPYEHIMGVAYGRYGSDGVFSRFNEGMLIATDRRLIFLDYKPGYTDLRELAYDVVSGVERVTAGVFSAVTVYTKIGDFFYDSLRQSSLR